MVFKVRKSGSNTLRSKKNLISDIESCKCEKHQKRNTYPFFFPMQNQKVMLITLSPSFQAAYRQLASIRFFRNIYLALFGPNPDIRYSGLAKIFLKKIYWTHYHKYPFEYSYIMPSMNLMGLFITGVALRIKLK